MNEHSTGRRQLTEARNGADRDTARTPVDIIARLQRAWDCEGNMILQPPFEHMALAALAGLVSPNSTFPLSVRGVLIPWGALTPEERRKLIYAARRIVEMARVSAWVFGADE
jgi:hypothetical protein